MSSRKRLALFVGTASLCAIAWSAVADAQIWRPFPYPSRYGGADGSVRLEVTPAEADVYVDGYYAGVVDDFDGAFQRLRVEAGEHEITVYRDGFRPFTQRIYVQPDRTFKLKQQLQPLQPGDVAEPRPEPANPPAEAERRGPGPRRDPGGQRPPPPNSPPPPPPDAGNAPAPESTGRGTISLRIQPADAEVLVDGQPWRVPDGQDRLIIDASEGRHNIQVRKAGYVGYLTDVQVRRGDTTSLNVTLRARP